MSTMILSSIFIFFLCFSMHTCNARYLAGAIDDKVAAASHEKLRSSTKVLENVELLKEEDSISADQKGFGRDGIVFHQISHHETSTVVKSKEPEDYSLDEMRRNREMPSVAVPLKRGLLVPVSRTARVVARKNYDERTENFKPSTLVGLLRATIIEGSRRRELLSSSNIEHGSSNGKEGRDKKRKEDASLMDYDPPHQKPPIHNRET